MAVYVDEPIHPFGRMMMCHMMADSMEELHAMADKIGVARKWAQMTRMPHYDICKSKRSLAVRYGAIETDSKSLVRRFLRKESPPASEGSGQGSLMRR